MSFEQELRSETIRVDLKHSAWSADESNWEERAPGALERMRAAFSGEGPAVSIVSSPGRETRSGTVTVSKGAAFASFEMEWDEPFDLATSVEEQLEDDMSDDEHKWASGIIADHLAENGSEFRRQRYVTAASFEELLASVDKVEEDLIAANQLFDRDFAGFVTGLADDLKQRRVEGPTP